MWKEENLRSSAAALCSDEFLWTRLEFLSSDLHGIRKAAVFVPLCIHNDDVYIWLTVRAAHLKSDPGNFRSL